MHIYIYSSKAEVGWDPNIMFRQDWSASEFVGGVCSPNRITTLIYLLTENIVTIDNSMICQVPKQFAILVAQWFWRKLCDQLVTGSSPTLA